MYDTFFRSEALAPTRTSIVALILRIGLAVIFLYHGLDKITSRNANAGANWVDTMYTRDAGVRVPGTLTFSGTQLAVSWGEFLGGLALAVGLLTRLAALGLIVIQVGAVVLVTLPRGFLAREGGYEYNLILIASCLALVILGAGMWSVDWLLVRGRERRAAGAGSAASPLGGPHGMAGQPAGHVSPGAMS